MHDLKVLCSYEADKIKKCQLSWQRKKNETNYLIVLYEGSTPSRGKRYDTIAGEKWANHLVAPQDNEVIFQKILLFIYFSFPILEEIST